jgi:hypothetical protein
MAITKNQLIESVFDGCRDMGARMRAFDGPKAVLGPLAQHPQLLRLFVCGASSFAGCLLFGFAPFHASIVSQSVAD